MEEERKAKKTSAWMASDHAGCGYYRMYLPSVALCRMGYPAHLMTIDRMHLYKNASVLVIQRPAEMTVESLVDEAHVSGVKVIFELDDNLWDLPRWNQAYHFWTDMRLRIAENIIRKCDRVTTTTKFLAEEIFSKFNDDIVVVPNAIFDHNYIDIPRQLTSGVDIVIGWVGSSFHLQDTEIFSYLIPKVLDKYPNVGFLVMGEPPPKSLTPHANRITVLPFVEPLYYHSILSSFTIDIGLAPLVDNRFNAAKSPLKIMEYLYTKSFPLCSDVEPYRVMKEENDECCLLVPTGTTQSGKVDDWMDAIDECIKNIGHYRQKAEKGREWILGKYNIESPYMRDIYKKAYFIDE